MPTNPKTTDAAFKLGKELHAAAVEALAAFLEAEGFDPPTRREELLIKVVSMQLSSSISKVLEEPFGDEEDDDA